MSYANTGGGGANGIGSIDSHDDGHHHHTTRVITAAPGSSSKNIGMMSSSSWSNKANGTSPSVIGRGNPTSAMGIRPTTSATSSVATSSHVGSHGSAMNGIATVGSAGSNGEEKVPTSDNSDWEYGGHGSGMSRSSSFSDGFASDTNGEFSDTDDTDDVDGGGGSGSDRDGWPRTLPTGASGLLAATGGTTGGINSSQHQNRGTSSIATTSHLANGTTAVTTSDTTATQPSNEESIFGVTPVCLQSLHSTTLFYLQSLWLCFQ
jgi:hypothetical protein